MENLIESVIDEASKEITKEIMKMSQSQLPDIDVSKVKLESQREKLNKSIDSFKSSTESALDDIVKDGSRCLESTKSDLKEYGTSLGLLTVGTAQFASRIAMVPPAIISATPVGPGVSASMIPPMLQDLKAEGDQLSKHYDDVECKRKKLNLDLLSYIPTVGGILSITDSTLALAKPLILMVGASVGKESGSLPEVDPPISIEYSADECLSFSPIDGYYDDEGNLIGGDVSASNCSNFSSMSDDLTPNCNNCKNFRK